MQPILVQAVQGCLLEHGPLRALLLALSRRLNFETIYIRHLTYPIMI